MRTICLSFCIWICASHASAAMLSGVTVDDRITLHGGQQLVLNGIGLREKFWVDVYVGSLYLSQKSSNVAEILSQKAPWRIQLDFVYKEVESEKLLEAWREGFEKNQSRENLGALQERIEQFYRYFNSNVKAGERYVLDYLPEEGTRVTRNQQVLGTISGIDFKNALLEIWLGSKPADKNLKRGLLGLK